MDEGLIGGLAEGLKQGLGSYRTERDYWDKKKQDAQEAAVKKKLYQLQLMGQGVEEGSSGELVRTDKSKRKDAFDEATKQAGLLKTGYKAEYDPASGRANLSKIDGFRDVEDDLKRSQIAKNYADARQTKKTDGKMIPASEAVATGGANASYAALGDVTKLVEDNAEKFGPGQGLISGVRGFFGVGKAAGDDRTIEANLAQRAQIIGKYLEGGKLTDADIGRYKGQLPQRGDSPEVAKNKIQSLQRLIAQKQESELAALDQAGYSTGGIKGTGGKPDLPMGSKRAPLGLISSAVADETKKPPTQGYVEAGYEFRGGDPNDKKNWKRVQ